MSDRHGDVPAQPRATRTRVELIEALCSGVVSISLLVAGSVLMLLATLGGPATVSGHFRLADDQTLVPLPIDDTCGRVTVPAIVTTLSLPNLPDLTTCSSTHTSSVATENVRSAAVNDSVSESRPSPSGTSATSSRVPITTARALAASSSTTSSGQSKTAAGVLGADAGTPSTGTDIAFGIGIGLVIAGAGIGTGTGAFLKRRRTPR